MFLKGPQVLEIETLIFIRQLPKEALWDKKLGFSNVFNFVWEGYLNK